MCFNIGNSVLTICIHIGVLKNAYSENASNLAGTYLLKVNNRNTKTKCEIYSKLTIKTLEWHLVLVFLLLTLNKYLPARKTLKGHYLQTKFLEIVCKLLITFYKTQSQWANLEFRATFVDVFHEKTSFFLSLSWRRFQSYRNQSVDLQSKSLNWLLYDRDSRHEKVKQF